MAAVVQAPGISPATLGQALGPAQLNQLGRLATANQTPGVTSQFGLPPAPLVTLPPIWPTSAVTATLTKTATSGITNPTTIPGNSAAFRYVGPPVTYNSSTTFYSVASMPSASGQPYKWSFWSDAPKVEFRLAGGNMAAELRVNGQTVQVGGASLITTDTSGAAYKLLIDWTVGGTVSNVSIPRKYEMQGLNILQAGIAVATTSATNVDSVWYPTEDDVRPLMMVFGDSYTNGTGAVDYIQTVAALTANMLGYEYWGDGYGGAGWLSTGVSAVSARMPVGIFAVRTADGAGNIKARPTPVVVSYFGYNDSSGSQSGILAAWNAWYASIRSTLGSKVPVITCGPWTPLGPTANLTTTEATLQGAVAAAAVSDPLVGFVSLDNIITTTNSGRYTGSDNIHPIPPLGHLYISTQSTPRMRAVAGL